MDEGLPTECLGGDCCEKGREVYSNFKARASLGVQPEKRTGKGRRSVRVVRAKQPMGHSEGLQDGVKASGPTHSLKASG